MRKKWICPFCNQGGIITSTNYHKKYSLFSNMVGEDKILVSEIVECPNPDCGQFILVASLYKDAYPGMEVEVMHRTRDLIKQWNLIPTSKAKSFPAYVPKPILADYEESCSVKDLSPKASATLSRRCLQGMIRDFWGISKKNLYEEIETIKDKVEPLTWEAVDSVREVGNIGAHMQKDINIIIDVDPHEANLLVELIETLIKDWYINRHEREEKLKALKKVGDLKKAQKKTQKTTTQTTKKK